jgi:hypothetical protein
MQFCPAQDNLYTMLFLEGIKRLMENDEFILFAGALLSYQSLEFAQ